MRRVIVVFLIGVGCLILSGCVKSMHATPHPHSDIEAPTFCLYEGWATKQDAKPEPIYRLRVMRVNKINDERIDWDTLKVLYAQVRPWSDQDTWDIEYAPDGKSDPPEKPFACITYGKVPPGYIEHIPAQSLIPERLYDVLIEPKGITPKSGVRFIIRADSTGKPIKLEYDFARNQIHVITPQ